MCAHRTLCIAGESNGRFLLPSEPSHERMSAYAHARRALEESSKSLPLDEPAIGDRVRHFVCLFNEVRFGWYTLRMDTYGWYATLIKPGWAPPAWLFGSVWSVLYIIIAISFAKIFYASFIKKELPSKVALPFLLNLIFNFSFTYLQFGLKNNVLAAADILLCLTTLIWALVAVYPRIRWVALVNVPYLLWVSFATVLQLTITYLNL